MVRGLAFVFIGIVAGCGPSILLSDDTDAAGETGVGIDGSASGTGTPEPPPPMPTTIDPASTSDDGGTFGADDATSDAEDTTDFILPTDWGQSCAPLPGTSFLSCCDVFAQDCPRGEKCMPWANDGGSSWNGTRCSPIADEPAELGESCMVEGSAVSGLDDCGAGAMCFYVDANTLEGTCVPMCQGDSSNPICPDDGICPVSGGGTLAVCLPRCNPLVGCPDGQVCSPWGSDFLCAASSDESLDFGEVCEFVNACSPGMLCAAPCDGQTCCTTFCDLAQGDPNPACPDAAAGQTCVPYYESPAPEGFETVGLCLPVE